MPQRSQKRSQMRPSYCYYKANKETRTKVKMSMSPFIKHWTSIWTDSGLSVIPQPSQKCSQTSQIYHASTTRFIPHKLLHMFHLNANRKSGVDINDQLSVTFHWQIQRKSMKSVIYLYTFSPSTHLSRGSRPSDIPQALAGHVFNFLPFVWDFWAIT